MAKSSISTANLSSGCGGTLHIEHIMKDFEEDKTQKTKPNISPSLTLKMKLVVPEEVEAVKTRFLYCLLWLISLFLRD